ncbi:MAG: ATP-binding protein [Pseudomonadota bacterium]
MIWLISAVCIIGIVTVSERALLAPLEENVNEIIHVLSERSDSDAFELFEWYVDILRIEAIPTENLPDANFETFIDSYSELTLERNNDAINGRRWLLGLEEVSPKLRLPLEFYQQLLFGEVPAWFHDELNRRVNRQVMHSDSMLRWQTMSPAERLAQILSLLSIDQQREGRCVSSTQYGTDLWDSTGLSGGDGFFAVTLPLSRSIGEKAVRCWVKEITPLEGPTFQYGVVATETLDIVLAIRHWRNIGIAVSFLVAALAGVLLGQRVYARVRRINALTTRIQEGELGHRLQVTGSGDDFDQLSANINVMLDKLEQLMEGVRQVSDNIAHDLRSPLTRLRNRIEELQFIENPSADNIRLIAGQADEVLATFTSMLRIAQLEQGSSRSQFTHFDFVEILHEVQDLYEPVFADAGIRLVLRHYGGPAESLGDRSLWTQVVTNLLDNALRYAPDSARVDLTLRTVKGGFVFTVKDQGPGVPDHMLSRLTERFFRAQQHRDSSGTGLGLALVAAICQLHGATIELMCDSGLQVTITMTDRSAT